MKDHLLAGFTAGLLVWAIVGFVNSSMAKAGEQKRIQKNMQNKLTFLSDSLKTMNLRS